METTKNSDNKYSGFIDGYIAGNIEANVVQLNLHYDNIIKFIREFEQEVKKSIFNKPGSEELPKLISAITNDSLNQSDEIILYTNLGENLKSLLLLLVPYKGDVPPYTLFLFKKIIYHYLNIAKTVNVVSILDFAKFLADKYASTWG